ARQRAFRPAAEGHHPDARPSASDLSEDGGVRPLWPRRARVHVGGDRQGRGAARGRGPARAGVRGRLKLFDPIRLRGLSLANRIVVSPMCQYSAVDGCATDWHLVHWAQMMMSGASMFTIEATAVTAEGRISPGDLGLYDDACEEAIARNLSRARAQCPPVAVAMQLAHAGRKASSRAPWDGGTLIPAREGGWHPVAPSA